MGKAAFDHTPELPLDDPRWLLFKAAHQRLAERTQDDELAAIQLAKALAQENGLRCLHLSATGERTLLLPEQWTARLMLWFGTDGLRVMERRDEFPNNPMRLRGWFYVWQPDLDRIWSTGGATVDHDNNGEPPRVRPGPKPHGDWPVLLEAWIADVGKDEPDRLRNISSLVRDAEIFLKKVMKWSPSNNSRLRREIGRIVRAARP